MLNELLTSPSTWQDATGSLFRALSLFILYCQCSHGRKLKLTCGRPIPFFLPGLLAIFTTVTPIKALYILGGAITCRWQILINEPRLLKVFLQKSALSLFVLHFFPHHHGRSYINLMWLFYSSVQDNMLDSSHILESQTRPYPIWQGGFQPSKALSLVQDRWTRSTFVCITP